MINVLSNIVAFYKDINVLNNIVVFYKEINVLSNIVVFYMGECKVGARVEMS